MGNFVPTTARTDVTNESDELELHSARREDSFPALAKGMATVAKGLSFAGNGEFPAPVNAKAPSEGQGGPKSGLKKLVKPLDEACDERADLPGEQNSCDVIPPDESSVVPCLSLVHKE